MMNRGVVRAICISERKGTPKSPIPEARFIENHGIENDAHAGPGNRQVSLLAATTIADFNRRGAEVREGAFGENLIIEGIDLTKLPIGTKFKCSDVELQLTEIGKECHTRCQIYNKMGDCIMPTNGVFAQVLKGGKVQVGDMITYS